MRMIFFAIILATAIVFSGCAHVETVERTIVRQVGSYQTTGDPKGKTTYHANCDDSSALNLSCTFTQKDRCDRSALDVFEHTGTLEKSTAWWVTVLEWTAAGGVLAAGVAVTVDASYISDNDPFNDNPIGRTGAFAIGGSLLGAGLGVASLAIVDSIRTIDEVKKIDRVEKVKSVVEISCLEKPLAHQMLHLEIGTKKIEIRTDERGNIVHELDSFIGEKTVLQEKAEPVVTIFKRNNVIARVRVNQYFEQIQAKERGRLALLAEKKEEIDQINREIARIADQHDGFRCLAHIDKNPDLIRNAAIYRRVDELRLCAAGALVNEAENYFKMNNLAAGTPVLIKLESLVPDHEALPRLNAARKQAFLGLTIELLRNWRIKEAQQLADRCVEILLIKKECQIARKLVAKADQIVDVAAFENQGRL